jgi:hypothetical protein
MVDIATGWTECQPLVARDGSLVVEAMTRAQSLLPWLIRGADFDNDSAFMNDMVVPWCREQKIEVTRSRAYKKNDQAFVEQKNGAVVRRLVGCGAMKIALDVDRWLLRVEAIIEWQQGITPECDNDRLFLGRQHRRAWLLGPVGRSATEVRFFHFATVFW